MIWRAAGQKPNEEKKQAGRYKFGERARPLFAAAFLVGGVACCLGRPMHSTRRLDGPGRWWFPLRSHCRRGDTHRSIVPTTHPNARRRRPPRRRHHNHHHPEAEADHPMAAPAQQAACVDLQPAHTTATTEEQQQASGIDGPSSINRRSSLRRLCCFIQRRTTSNRHNGVRTCVHPNVCVCPRHGHYLPCPLACEDTMDG